MDKSPLRDLAGTFADARPPHRAARLDVLHPHGVEVVLGLVYGKFSAWAWRRLRRR